jgi:endonuclease/exonuclease/phosphatase (EEP) superfamily protein YafD
MNARAMFAGAAAALSLLAVATGIGAWALPTEVPGGPLARILDAGTPLFLGAGLLLAVLTVVSGAWRTGLLLALVCAGAAIAPITAYRDVTRPADPAAQSDLRVLFFNAMAQNGQPGSRIAEAAIATGADILVFAEAEPLMDARELLEAEFEFVSPCMGETCELLIATNLPVLRSWQLSLNPAWAERYAVLEVEVPDRGTLFVAAGHMAKPWMSGIAEAELARMTAQLNWLTGPSVVVGDFNMPPWSRPMRNLLQVTGFRTARASPATWPADAPAMLRLPIDHVLVRDEVALGAVESFGAGFGSNHLGLVADIVLP